jgi:hypothetical protein
MLGGDDRVAGLEMRILEHVRGPVDEACRHTVLVHRLQHLARVQGLGPSLDESVEQLLVAATRLVVHEARVFRPFALAHRVAEATEHRVLVGGDEHEAVARLVDVGGGDVRQDRTGAFTDVAGLVVFGDQRLHHGEHSLVERGVHHLSTAGLLAVVQRGQRADAGEGGREFVADADPHP